MPNRKLLPQTKSQTKQKKSVLGCSECPLNGQHKMPPIQFGDEPKYVIVTKPAAPYEIESQEFFNQYSGTVLYNAFNRYRIPLKDLAIIPSVQCHFDPDRIETKIKKQIKKQCELRLHRAIKRVNPDVVIPLGAEAASSVIGRGVKITKARGVLVDYPKDERIKVYPLLDPQFVSMYSQHQPTFDADMATFKKMIDFRFDLGALEEDFEINFKIIEDLDEVIELAKQGGALLSFDIETIGLRFAEPAGDIVCMQFSFSEDMVYFLPWAHSEYTLSDRKKNKVKRQLKYLFEEIAPELLGQNLKFDLTWVLYRLGVRGYTTHDTLLIAALLNENDTEKNLDSLTRRYVPALRGYADKFNAEFDKSRMDLVPLDRLIRYACGDVIATRKVFEVLYPQLQQDQRLHNVYEYVTVPASNTFSAIEARGRLISLERLSDFEKVMAESVEKQYRDLMAQVPRPIKRKHIEKGLKFSRPDFTRDILFDHPKGYRLRPKVFTDSTKNLDPDKQKASLSSKDHLPFFFDECSFTMELTKYVKDERLLSTSIRGFREKYILGGKIYPVYSLSTAVTGRSASRDPNGQNFPNKGETGHAYGRCFISEPGYVLVQADLSQAEIRIAAIMANDPVLIGIYRRGEDVHAATAASVMGYTKEQWNALSKTAKKKFRQAAKAVNFGYLYGMWWRKFRSYAKTQYGVEFTENESRRARETFFSGYPGIDPWHEKMRRLVRKQGFVRSPLGRIRHLPTINSPEDWIAQEAERQGINCVDATTECLTEHGWRTYDQIQVGDLIWAWAEGVLRLEEVRHMNVYPEYEGEVYCWDRPGFSACVTPNHRWLAERTCDSHGNKQFVMVESSRLKTGPDMTIVKCAPSGSPDAEYSREFLQLIAWAMTDGSYATNHSTVRLYQSEHKHAGRIRALLNTFGKWTEARNNTDEHRIFTIPLEQARKIRSMFPDRVLTTEFIFSLSANQAAIVINTMLDADGTRESAKDTFYCGTSDKADLFQCLCTVAGFATSKALRKGYKNSRVYESIGYTIYSKDHYAVRIHRRRRVHAQYGKEVKQYRGLMWCPTVESGTFVMRRDGKTCITGNSPVQGMASDLGLLAMNLIDADIDPAYLSLCGFVHDAIYAYVPEQYADWAARTMKYYMENVPLEELFGIKLPIPIVADVAIGYDLGDKYELENLTHDTPYDYSKTPLKLPVQVEPPNGGRLQ